MSNDRNFVRRGDLHGPLFELDHLATFTVGSKQGLLKAEDGMRKLRVMEKSQGIWTMECQMMIDVNYLVVLDKKTGVRSWFLFVYNWWFLFVGMFTLFFFN